MNQLIAVLSVLSVASAAPQLLLGAGHFGYGLGFNPYVYAPYALPVVKPNADKADGMVTYNDGSGAVVPEEPLINQIVKAEHLAVKTGLPHQIFKREAEAEAEAEAKPALTYYTYPFYNYGYGLYNPYVYAPYALPLVYPTVPVVEPNAEKADGMVTYNDGSGAVVPEEPLINQIVRASHLAVKTGLPHKIFKREADAEAEAYWGYGLYHGHPATHSYGLTYYANGAVTPTKTPAVQAATIAHLATKAATYASRGYGYYGYGFPGIYYG